MNFTLDLLNPDGIFAIQGAASGNLQHFQVVAVQFGNRHCLHFLKNTIRVPVRFLPGA